jgi:sortase A
MTKKSLTRVLALIMGIAGLSILIATIYPIASYEALSRSKFPSLLSPLVEKDTTKLEDYDYTKASNWFVGGAEKADFELSKVSYYNISIPKLRIDNAVVAIGGDDLSKHLIQYPGTALPGKRGNAVIFGHSILPRFYNPKDYMSIFSLLPTLEKGDQITIYYDSVEYLYRVEDMFEVSPTDIQVLEQNSSDSYLTLVTCTPPGDPRKLKRLIVRAKIVVPESAGVNSSTNL